MKAVAASVERVLALPQDEYAVVVRSEAKAFLIFVGQSEAYSIFRELRGQTPRRPLAHDLMANFFRGFEIEVDQVVISSIVDSTFCATLIASQAPQAASAPGRESEPKRIVRLDLRASDAMILALKTKTPLLVTAGVIDQVEDVTAFLGPLGGDSPFPEEG